MNVFKLFITTFWSQSKDIFSLQRLVVVLQKLKVSSTKKNKEFHTYKDFFQIVIQANLIVFCIIKLEYTNNSTFQTWLSCNNWSTLMKLVKKNHLKSFVVHKLKHQGEQQVKSKVAHLLKTY